MEKHITSKRKNRPNKIGKELEKAKPVYFALDDLEDKDGSLINDKKSSLYSKNKDESAANLPDIFDKELNIPLYSPLEAGETPHNSQPKAQSSKPSHNDHKFTEQAAQDKLISHLKFHGPDASMDGAKAPEPLIDLSLSRNPFATKTQKKKRILSMFGSKKKKPKPKILSYAGLLLALFVGSWAIGNAPALIASFKYTLVDSSVLDSKPSETIAAKPSPLAAHRSNRVGGPDKIIIAAIGVNAPLVLSERQDEKGIMKDLEKGVAHYGNTPLPGQAGNSVLFGHSSNYLWAPGKFKHVFALLPKIKVGDKIEVRYTGRKYIYKVSDIKEVSPKEVKVLKSTSKASKLTLIACTPVGTSLRRIIVTAVQTSPKVDKSPSDIPHLPQV